jgi:hypothetical protein
MSFSVGMAAACQVAGLIAILVLPERAAAIPVKLLRVGSGRAGVLRYGLILGNARARGKQKADGQDEERWDKEIFHKW